MFKKRLPQKAVFVKPKGSSAGILRNAGNEKGAAVIAATP
jgi:hypothetical protein